MFYESINRVSVDIFVTFGLELETQALISWSTHHNMVRETNSEVVCGFYAFNELTDIW